MSLTDEKEKQGQDDAEKIYEYDEVDYDNLPEDMVKNSKSMKSFVTVCIVIGAIIVGVVCFLLIRYFAK